MKPLTLFALILILLIPSTGRAQTDTRPIAPCLPANADLIRLEGANEWGETWVNVVRDMPAFYALEGEPIEWLGYAPKGQEYKEWQGVEYGFGGVDMTKYGEQFYIMLYGTGSTFAKREIIGRIEVHQYKEQYILFMTTLHTFGLSDGSRNAYHIFAVNGQACMFFVGKDDFNEVLGWK